MHLQPDGHGIVLHGEVEFQVMVVISILALEQLFYLVDEQAKVYAVPECNV